MGSVVALALAAALNPTLLAATTVMLLLPAAGRLMFGYWLGAMLTGVAAGLVFVFALKGTGAEHTTRHTVGPGVWLVVAALLVVGALALARGETKRRRDLATYREKEGKKEKKTPKWQKLLQEGNAWHTFVVGILLSFPGAGYLAALDRVIHLHYSTFVTVVVVIGFNLVQNLLLEIPMLAFRIWPKETPAAIDKAKAWASRYGREYAAWALGFLGVALAIPSVIALLSR